jgi:20S proteasome alpha/beta subunit
LQDISNEYTLNEAAISSPMTLILGSRCKDGVVLVADKKVTLGYGADFDYREKLFGEIRHVIVGSSGSTDTFEYFRGYIMDYVRMHRNDRKSITFDNIITKLSEITYNINKKHKFQFEYSFNLLVAVGYESKPSSLTFISAFGWPRTIDGCLAIGSGQSYAKVFLKRVWHADMNMKQVAEIGHFIIKYVEEFDLDRTVGVGDKHPQLWFIKDRNDDKVAKQSFLNTLQAKTERRLENHRKHLIELFKEIV